MNTVDISQWATIYEFKHVSVLMTEVMPLPTCFSKMCQTRSTATLNAEVQTHSRFQNGCNPFFSHHYTALKSILSSVS